MAVPKGRVARQVRLQWLSLKRCRAVTDGSLADLAPLTRLTHLSLARCFKVRPPRWARPAHRLLPSAECSSMGQFLKGRNDRFPT